MGFLMPKAPQAATPPNPSILASGTRDGGTGPRFSGDSFLSASATGTLKRKSDTIKTSLIGGG